MGMYGARSCRYQQGKMMGIDDLASFDNQWNIPSAGFGHRLPNARNRQQYGQRGSLIVQGTVA
jgi:hypothetical protein